MFSDICTRISIYFFFKSLKTASTLLLKFSSYYFSEHSRHAVWLPNYIWYSSISRFVKSVLSFVSTGSPVSLVFLCAGSCVCQYCIWNLYIGINWGLRWWYIPPERISVCFCRVWGPCQSGTTFKQLRSYGSWGPLGTEKPGCGSCFS